MTNALPFEEFLRTLQSTNRHLSFFVDWKKCLQNKDSIAICLNHLNFLLGKNKEQIKNATQKLFGEYPKAFEVLPILLAVRDKKDLVLDSTNHICTLESYLTNADKAYEFICESGLCDVFSNKNIKDLNDFVFGVEVGLDSNARKNRGGSVMEITLKNIFTQAKICFKEQVNIQTFGDLYQCFGDDIKRFDFVIYAKTKIYFIESNFYTSGGSKLNETARSYQEIALKFKAFKQYEFIWITDGQGWLSAKTKLQEAYKNVKIYNLHNLKDFIAGIYNDNKV
ncbi:type II restriction endonuclease [Helicobacter rodentium]|uniref:type II restriction endonuclease n=1 Tax=Helicobacter rodentium TaxID=59617 RepID=UPI0023543C06|nr:type II restriction endonuclease [Helicobacter rodentium]